MSTVDRPPKRKRCPHTGFAKSCRKLVEAGHCDRWTEISRQNAQGKAFNVARCNDDWGVHLQVETSTNLRRLGKVAQQSRNIAARALGEAPAAPSLPPARPPAMLPDRHKK